MPNNKKKKKDSRRPAYSIMASTKKRGLKVYTQLSGQHLIGAK